MRLLVGLGVAVAGLVFFGMMLIWLDLVAVAAALFAFSLSALCVACVTFGYMLGQKNLVKGGDMVLHAQHVNDQWDAKKFASMVGLVRVAANMKPDGYAPMTVDGEIKEISFAPFALGDGDD